MLKCLPKLSAKELEQVRLRISFLQGVTKPSGKVAPSQDWLLEGFTAELRRRGLWAQTYPIPAKLLPGDYATKAEHVRQHLLTGYVKPNPRLVERMALGALAGTVLADYLTKIKVPVGPKTLLGNVEKVPVALEESFPGYWAQGLLGFCIEARE